ncbi:hypothetical protein [Rhodococcus koreensis]
MTIVDEHSPNLVNSRRLPWPVRPESVYLTISGISILATAWLTPSEVFTLTGGVQDAPSEFFIQLAMVWLGGFVGVAAAYLGRDRNPGYTHKLEGCSTAIRHGVRVVGGLVVAAYAFWAIVAVWKGLRPGTVVAVLNGDAAALQFSRSTLVPVTGITSLVAFAGPVLAVYAFRRFRYERVDRIIIVTLIGGSIMRMFLNAERLALMEILVPATVALLLRTPRNLLKRFVIVAITLPGCVYLVFAVGEYVRPSYTMSSSEESFTSYLNNRLGGYYVSSNVNGYYLLDSVESTPAPNYTADALWNAPLLGDIISPREVIGFDSRKSFRADLNARLNPELNTVSGLASLRAEWGVGGGMCMNALLGFALAVVGRRLSTSDPVHAAVYGVLIVGAIESTRYPYYFQSRFMLGLIGCYLIYRLARNPRSGQ